MVKYFSWCEFDKSVEYIANKCKFLEFSGIYGVPRGGLCLAVALSHKLKINLISKPKINSLIVDDVYETGRTLQALQARFPHAGFAVWVSKCPPLWWTAAAVTDKSEWLLFPWENPTQASADEQTYQASRRGDG